MTDKIIQQWIESNMFHEDGTPMIDTQVFFEGAKWMRRQIYKSLQEKIDEYKFEKYKSGFAVMEDRTLLKEYWNGCERGVKDIMKQLEDN